MNRRMKAEELRICNFVSLGGNNFPVELPDISRLQRYPNEYSPIPLTEEWLERFNWNPPKDIGVSFSLTTDEIHFVAGNYYRKIEYVHQLQNLYFALVGEELTIKE